MEYVKVIVGVHKSFAVAASLPHLHCACLVFPGTAGVAVTEQQLNSVEGEQRRRDWRHKKPSQERAPVPTNAEPLAKRLKLIEEVAADSKPQPQADQPQKVCM